MAEPQCEEAKLTLKDRRVLRDITESRLRMFGERLRKSAHIDEALVRELYECVLAASWVIDKPIPTGFDLVYKKGVPAHYRDSQGKIYGDDRDFSSERTDG